MRVHISDDDDVRLLDQEADLYEERDTTNGDFTFRAVFVGLLVGVILCMTNIYFGLQVRSSLCPAHTRLAGSQ
jgi:hypothetical protein